MWYGGTLLISFELWNDYFGFHRFGVISQILFNDYTNSLIVNSIGEILAFKSVLSKQLFYPLPMFLNHHPCR
jgi:hypothetical protein